ncbi:MAG TPA: flagellar motor stator protein MotA [Bryobacteraceae bacterium]|nr:flagellar motor stator protein MotA [Bryobacteraceae bacterium]
MTLLAGLVLVLGAVALGYVLEQGNLLVLVQPAELLIILGSAMGIILVSNPPRNLRKLFSALWSMRHRNPYTAGFYIDVLKLIYVLLAYAQRQGVAVLEQHVENPDASTIFSQYPAITEDGAALMFVCDSIRTVTATGIDAEELDRVMSADLEVQRAGRQQAVNALLNLADSLPGLGIVAAVLGVVVTMQALGGPASEIGHKVAAALVGTFLGILLCYGVVGPIATNLQHRNRARLEVLQVLRAALTASLRGSSPIVAAEFARRSIPLELRPSYDEMETELRRNTKLPAVRGAEG